MQPVTKEAMVDNAAVPDGANLLNAATQTIEQLFKDSGTVGGSIGVLSNGKQHLLSVGARHLDAPGPPDENTIFLISSMTKPILGLAMALLIDSDGYNIGYVTPVKDLLPELAGKTLLRHVPRELTVADLLDHRSEFLKTTSLWESPDGDIPWKTVDPIISLLQHLPLNDKFESASSFVYNRNYSNECYALAATIIERQTKVPWARFVKEEVLQPLGMHNTVIGSIDKGQAKAHFAGYHAVKIDEILDKLPEWVKETNHPFLTILHHIREESPARKPIRVIPSKASEATDSDGQTPLGAAAGMRSTVSDLLRLCQSYLDMYEVYTQNKKPEQMTEIQRAMLRQIRYIATASAEPTRTNAGGWNVTHIPWDPTATPSPRWPGADGDNARRLSRAFTQELFTPATHAVNANLAWAFFHGPRPSHKPSAYRASPQDATEPAEKTTTTKTVALYHGGNMVGATSFIFLHPATKTAVVVLCNTRGFFLDAANLSGMLLADLLVSPQYYRAGSGSSGGGGASDAHDRAVAEQCARVREAGRFISAQYLCDVLRYETDLVRCYPDYLDAERYGAYAGRYQLTEGIFASVEADWGKLWFRLYDLPMRYPLRCNVAWKVGGGGGGRRKLMKATFAMSMRELLPTGVGGENRLTLKEFDLVFREGEGGRPVGFYWAFNPSGTPVEDDSDAFLWKRVD